MAINFYAATSLIGGGTGALDNIDGADLADGDGAVVITEGVAYFYYLDVDSAAGESSPDIISPDANAGDKRWILDTVYGGDTYGEFSDEDSDGNAMLKDHAYLAQQDGFITCYMISSGAAGWLNAYMGPTNDPAGAGTRIHSNSAAQTDWTCSVGFQVAAGKYFEFTTSTTTPLFIFWHPKGVLSKPIDQN